MAVRSFSRSRDFMCALARLVRFIQRGIRRPGDPLHPEAAWRETRLMKARLHWVPRTVPKVAGARAECKRIADVSRHALRSLPHVVSWLAVLSDEKSDTQTSGVQVVLARALPLA